MKFNELNLKVFFICFLLIMTEMSSSQMKQMPSIVSTMIIIKTFLIFFLFDLNLLIYHFFI
jgi:hypothetical protein